MNRRPTDQQVAQFRKDGFLIVRGLLTKVDVSTLKEHIAVVASGAAGVDPARLQKEPRVVQGEAEPASRADSYRKMSHLAFEDQVFRSHALNDRILDCIEALLGDPDIKLYQDQLFMKPPRIGSRQSYHQDQPLGFTVEPSDRMVTCWAALDDATIANGCLWMLPGTHRHGRIDRKRWQEFEAQALAGELAQEQPVELKVGDCSFHHGHILHSSRPNLTDQRRWGYATHYVSAHCRFTGEGESDAILARGRSIPGCV